jgi:hypothetical protein
MTMNPESAPDFARGTAADPPRTHGHGVRIIREGEDSALPGKAILRDSGAFFQSGPGGAGFDPLNLTYNQYQHMMKIYDDEENFEGRLACSLADRFVRWLLMAAGCVLVALTGVALVCAVCAALVALMALGAALFPGLLRLGNTGGHSPLLILGAAAFAFCGLAALTYTLRSCGVWCFDRADEIA